MTLPLKAGSLSLLLYLLLSAAARAAGQALPVVEGYPSTGFELPRVSGTLRYGVTVSEGVNFSYAGTGQTTTSTNFSGNVGYLSRSIIHPFSVVYSGAYLAATQGQPSSFVQNLALSQVIAYKRLNFVFSDAVSYLPINPVSGLSGIPGLGDQNVAPVQVGQDQGSPLLSGYGARLTNSASVGGGYSLTGRTSLSGSGVYQAVRFPGGNANSGVENDTYTGSAGLSRRLDALTTLSGNYAYTHSSYPALSQTYDTQGVTAEYARRWNSRFSSDVAVGPQYSTSTGELATLNYSVNASATYQLDGGGLGAAFVRSTNSGSGVTVTSRSNSAQLSASRHLGPYVNASVSLSYNNSTTLPSLLGNRFTSSGMVAGFQWSRSLSRNLSTYASYTLQRQNTDSSSLAVNALQGLSQSLGFGLTYSPRPIEIGH